MCHVPEQAFTNNELATSVGVEGRSGRRNAPSLLNVAYMRHLFHDGRETALETQYIAPHVGLDPRIEPLRLSTAEADDLLAFLRSLTSQSWIDLIDEARTDPPGNRSR